MAQFDVYSLSGAQLVVDVQSDRLQPMSSRLVIPLVIKDTTVVPFGRLNPTVTVAGAEYLLLSQQLGAVPTRLLHHPIGSLRDRADSISLALDMVFHGF